MHTYITALHKYFRSRQLIASIGFQFQQWYLEIKENYHGVAVAACIYILLPILILIHQVPRGSDNETGVGASLVNICDLQIQTAASVKHSFPKRCDGQNQSGPVSNNRRFWKIRLSDYS